MNYIKRNKGTIISITVFIILVILLYQLVTMFFPKMGTAIYGNRLEGIEKVQIEDNRYSKIKKELTKDNILEINSKRSGKIIKFFLTVKPETDINTSKSYGNKILEYFDNQEKAFYDFEFYVDKKENNTNFPIIGYKHHKKANISWTKDR